MVGSAGNKANSAPLELELRLSLAIREKNGVFSGHYVIASSLPPERLRPNDDRWNVARSCQFEIWIKTRTVIFFIWYMVHRIIINIIANKSTLLYITLHQT